MTHARQFQHHNNSINSDKIQNSHLAPTANQRQTKTLTLRPNPLSHHRSRPHKTTNAVPLNQAHKRTQPGAIGELLHHASRALPDTALHAALGALAEPNKQGRKTLGSQRRGLATPLAFIGPTGGLIPQHPACPIGLAVRGVEPRQGRPDNNEYIKSNTKYIEYTHPCSILIFLVNWTAYTTNRWCCRPKIPQRSPNRCWCFSVSCHVYSGLFLTLLTG